MISLSFIKQHAENEVMQKIINNSSNFINFDKFGEFESDTICESLYVINKNIKDANVDMNNIYERVGLLNNIEILPPENFKGEHEFGNFDSQKMTISINDKYSDNEDTIKETIIHEIMHSAMQEHFHSTPNPKFERAEHPDYHIVLASNGLNLRMLNEGFVQSLTNETMKEFGYSSNVEFEKHQPQNAPDVMIVYINRGIGYAREANLMDTLRIVNSNDLMESAFNGSTEIIDRNHKNFMYLETELNILRNYKTITFEEYTNIQKLTINIVKSELAHLDISLPEYLETKEKLREISPLLANGSNFHKLNNIMLNNFEIERFGGANTSDEMNPVLRSEKFISLISEINKITPNCIDQFGISESEYETSGKFNILKEAISANVIGYTDDIVKYETDPKEIIKNILISSYNINELTINLRKLDYDDLITPIDQEKNNLMHVLAASLDDNIESKFRALTWENEEAVLEMMGQKNQYGQNPFQMAIELKNEEFIIESVLNGYEIPDDYKSFPILGKNNNLLLTKLLRESKLNEFDCLVECGANLSFADKKGNTILHYFANDTIRSNSFMDEDLFKKVDVNHQNEDGMTALHIAAKNNSSFCMELISLGANVEIPDLTGKKPLENITDEVIKELVMEELSEKQKENQNAFEME